MTEKKITTKHLSVIFVVLERSRQVAVARKRNESRAFSLTIISIPCVQSLRRGLHVALEKDVAVDGRRY